MKSDPPHSKPELPAMPLDAVLEASAELAAHSKLRNALVLLVTKIDKGFASILFYMRSIRERVSMLARQQEGHELRIRQLEDELAALKSWRDSDAKVEAARERENTARHELAAARGEAKALEKVEAKEERRARRQDEWNALDNKWKIAIAGGVLTLLTALTTGTLKLIEIFGPMLFGGSGGS